MTQAAKQNTQDIAPHNVLNQLCKISQSLLDIAEQESQALVQNDLLSFAVLQDEKESLSKNYLDQAELFHSNLNAFRRLDQALIARLEKTQAELSEKTKNNNNLINSIQQNAERFVAAGMATALEYGSSDRAQLNAQEAIN